MFKNKKLTAVFLFSIVAISVGTILFYSNRSVDHDSSHSTRLAYTAVDPYNPPPDESTTPEKVEQVLLANKNIVKIRSKRRLKNNTVFVGNFIFNGGYRKPNKCVATRFAIIVGKSVFKESEESKIIGGKVDSGSRFGNISTVYLEDSCDDYPAYLADIIGRKQIDIEKQIRNLMPGLPDGP